MENRTFETSYGTASTIYKAGDPSFVFIHGLAGDKNIFSPAFEHPMAAGKELLSIDLLGFGESCRLNESTDYRFSVQAEVVREVLKSAGVTSFRLALHSMASGILPELLRFKEIDIQSIFLLESNMLAEESDWSRELSEMSDEEYRVYFKKIQKAARFVLASQLRRSHSRELVEQWSSCFIRADKRALRETAIELHQRTISGEIVEAMKTFNGQIVYLRGMDNRPWKGQALLEQLGIELIGLPNAGHYLMLDDPESVYSAVFRDQPVLV
jgi:pimeloyl-ACP methyl ester carboxylesterase